MFRDEAFLTGRSQKILLELYRRGTEVVKTSLLSVVRNSYSLERHLHELEEHGLVKIREEKIIRRTFYVSLTELGKSIASQLIDVTESMAASTGAENERPIVRISDQEARDWAEKFKEATRNLSLLYHVNVFEDHVTIGEEKDGRLRVINVYVRVNGHGIMRLWCEEDESFDCIHVKYAWTLPKVQEMIQMQRDKGNMKD